jgi:hypothetical protein
MVSQRAPQNKILFVYFLSVLDGRLDCGEFGQRGAITRETLRRAEHDVPLPHRVEEDAGAALQRRCHTARTCASVNADTRARARTTSRCCSDSSC